VTKPDQAPPVPLEDEHEEPTYPVKSPPVWQPVEQGQTRLEVGKNGRVHLVRRWW
jgi:hypothetical protein